MISTMKSTVQRGRAPSGGLRQAQVLLRRSLARSSVKCFMGASATSKGGSVSSKVARVTFKIPYRVHFGQQLGIVGSVEPLGGWDPTRIVVMKWNDGDWWSADMQVALEPSTSRLDIEYKYLVRNADGRISYWKPGSNYKLSVVPKPNKVLEAVRVSDAWDDSFREVDLDEKEAAAGHMPSGSPPSASRSSSPPPSPSIRAPQPPPAASSNRGPSKATSSLDIQPDFVNTAVFPSSSAYAHQSAVRSNGASAPSPAAAPRPVAASTPQPQQPQQSPPTPVPPLPPPPQPSAPQSQKSTLPPYAAKSFPTIQAQNEQPLKPAEQLRLEEGIRKSLEDLQAQMEMHQHLREQTEDPAALEVLVADRMVAAANNKVVAYNKALKAVEAYAQLPTSASSGASNPKQS